MSNERNWMDLPTELIHLISRKLPPDYLYFILFRAVCKSWRFSAPVSDPHPYLPWLLECSKRSSGDTCSKEELRIYSFASGKITTIHVQDLICKSPMNLIAIEIDKYDFLVVLATINVSVPFQEISLAPYRLKDLQQVCNDPSEISNYNWPVIFDMIPTDKIMFMMTAEHGFFYVTSHLVKSCGEILRVILFRKDDHRSDPLCLFHIYKLSKKGEDGQSYWVKICDIGDQILFLDDIDGFTVSAPPGYKGNCIYVILRRTGFHSVSVWRFDISTSITNKVLCPFETCRWIFPFN